MKNAKTIFDAVQSDAKAAAVLELAEKLSEGSKDIWSAMKEKVGKKNAAYAVVSLLLCAIEDGDVYAFEQQDDEHGVELDDRRVDVDVVDDGCFLIRGSKFGIRTDEA